MATSAEKALDNFNAVVRFLEKKSRTRIFSIIHPGDPYHICHPTIWSFIDRRAAFDKLDTLELLIHSPGGHPGMAFKIMKFLRRRCKHINAIVPLEAKSAATLMCFGADTVFMGEFAELGPLDIQIDDPIEKGLSPSPLSMTSSRWNFCGNTPLRFSTISHSC